MCLTLFFRYVWPATLDLGRPNHHLDELGGGLTANGYQQYAHNSQPHPHGHSNFAGQTDSRGGFSQQPGGFHHHPHQQHYGDPMIPPPLQQPDTGTVLTTDQMEQLVQAGRIDEMQQHQSERRNMANMQNRALQALQQNGANAHRNGQNGANTVHPSPGVARKQAPNSAENTALFVNGKPYKMPTTKEQLKIELAYYVRNLERLRIKNITLTADNVTLTDDINELKRTSVKSLKNEKVVERIKERFATHMFRRRKFINDQAEQEEAASEMFEYCHTEKDKLKFANEKNYKQNWVNTYKDAVTMVCNKRRSTIQGALRTAVMVFAEKHKHTITVQDIMKCIFRQIDVAKPEDVQLFKWYWTELLGKHVQLGQLGH